MWHTNRRIGFDDRLVTVILVPVAALIIPFVFFGMSFTAEPRFTWREYLSTLIVTTVIWIGNRWIMIWARTRYPLFGEVRKRLIVQSAVMLVYTIIANNILGYFLDFCGLNHHHLLGLFRIVTSSNAAAIFCTLT